MGKKLKKQNLPAFSELDNCSRVCFGTWCLFALKGAVSESDISRSSLSSQFLTDFCVLLSASVLGFLSSSSTIKSSLLLSSLISRRGFISYVYIKISNHMELKKKKNKVEKKAQSLMDISIVAITKIKEIVGPTH